MRIRRSSARHRYGPARQLQRTQAIHRPRAPTWKRRRFGNAIIGDSRQDSLRQVTTEGDGMKWVLKGKGESGNRSITAPASLRKCRVTAFSSRCDGPWKPSLNAQQGQSSLSSKLSALRCQCASVRRSFLVGRPRNSGGGMSRKSAATFSRAAILSGDSMNRVRAIVADPRFSDTPFTTS